MFLKRLASKNPIITPMSAYKTEIPASVKATGKPMSRLAQTSNIKINGIISII